MRQLASIQRVVSVEPIPNADQIEKITVLGWHLVAKKGEFKAGDLCCYFEVDSLLPLVSAFDFLKDKGTKTILVDGKKVEGYRLRTIKLRKQISQGLALPLESLGLYGYTEGMDVTEKLGVLKYEMPVAPMFSGSGRSIVGKPFPAFIPKTDETRLQSKPSLLQRYASTPFFVTEKLDGSSVTFYMEKGKLNVCSRNINIPEDVDTVFTRLAKRLRKLFHLKPKKSISPPIYWKMAYALGLKEKMAAIGDNIALQGELVGESVNGNHLNLSGNKVYFFNAYDIYKGEYLSFQDFVNLCAKLGLETVPIIDKGFMLKSTVDEMVAYATGKSVISPSVLREGLVFRPLTEMHDENLGRLSFKVISAEYLLKNEEA